MSYKQSLYSSHLFILKRKQFCNHSISLYTFHNRENVFSNRAKLATSLDASFVE